jgi:hypothetical protein
LQRQAAEQYLTSGYIDRGLAALEPCLAAHGLTLPRSSARALFRFLLQKIGLHLRHPRLRFRARSENEIAPEIQERLSLCWSAAVGLFTIDAPRALYFHAKHLSLALSSGSPAQIGRGLLLEAASLAAIGVSPRRVERMMARAESIARNLDQTANHNTAYMQAGITLANGSIALLAGEWLRAAQELERGHDLLQEQPTALGWELRGASLNKKWAWGFLGRLREMASEVEREVETAEARGDRYRLVGICAGFPNLTWLMKDRPEEARARTTEAMQRWSHAGFHLQHLFEVYALTHVDLYMGHGRGAHRRISENLRQMRRAGLFRIELNRLLVTELEGRAALAMALTERAHRSATLDLAADAARRLARSHRNWATGCSALMEGQLAQLAGKPQLALAELRRAEQLFELTQMALHLQVTRALIGRIQDGSASTLESGAMEEFALRGVGQPDRFARMLAPALGAPASYRFR